MGESKPYSNLEEENNEDGSDMEELEAQLNEIESALDNLESQNDNIHSKLKELLESNKEIRKEMASLGMVNGKEPEQTSDSQTFTNTADLQSLSLNPTSEASNPTLKKN